MKNSYVFKKAIEKGLTVCHADIETSPELLYAYALRKADVQHNQIIVPYQVTSIGWMFEDEEDVHVRGWDDSRDKDGSFDILKPNRDIELLKTTVPILNEADILIGQNSINFDEKKLRWRLNLFKLSNLEQLISIDILQQSYRVFSPTSHKLDFRSKAYGYGGKMHQDMNDCIRVAMGDKKAQKNRMIYNAKDVKDARKVFWRELDYYQLPQSVLKTLKMYVDTEECTFCIKCAAKRYAKFNIARQKTKTHTKMTCRNCDYTWKINNE